MVVRRWFFVGKAGDIKSEREILSFFAGGGFNLRREIWPLSKQQKIKGNWMQCIFVDGKRFHFRGFHFRMQF